MEDKKVSWLELFFDLVFVTAVSYTTHLFVQIDHHPDRMPLYFGEYLLMVFPMFWLWTGQTMFFNRFGEHLKRPELFMLPQMFFFILMTASLDFDFNHTYHTWLLSYLALRLCTLAEYLSVGKHLTGDRREAARLLALIFLPGVLIPLSSLMFEGHSRYVVMYAGITADMLLPIFFGRKLSRAPVHLGHLTERFGLFVLITFGEALVSITGILTGHTTDRGAIRLAVLSFLIIAAMWSSYFRAYETVVDRSRQTNGQLLLYSHFLILVSVMMLAADIELISEGHLKKIVQLAFLYPPVLLFFVAKHLIFYHHRKSGTVYYRLATGLALLALVGAFGLNFAVDLPVQANLVIVCLLCLAEALIQAGVHKKVFRH